MTYTGTTQPVAPPNPPKRHRTVILTVLGVAVAAVIAAGAVTALTSGPHHAASVPKPAASTLSPIPVNTVPPQPAAQSQPAQAQTTAPSPAAPAGATASQQQALTSAQGYLSDGQGFSRQGLITQLDSPYGGQFSVADATWAAGNSGADWNAQAVIAARNYLSDGQGFSRQGLITQLDSPYGGQFTYAQAVYGTDQAGL